MKAIKQSASNYVIAAMSLLGVYIFSSQAPAVETFFAKSPEHHMESVFFIISVLFALSFIVFYVSRVAKLPSFVFAIFFGIAAHEALLPITENEGLLSILVALGATLILFGGGIETPFHSFKKLMGKILSLSFPGLFITSFLFSWAVYGIAILLGHPLSIPVAVLLGAVLASTDPAAIIPILKDLRFKNNSIKDIIVSESAVTDVAGTLLTVIFIAIVTSAIDPGTLNSWYGAVFTPETGIVLAEQLFFGVVAGLLGYGLLEGLHKFKHSHDREFEVDSAFFLFVPIIIFAIALAFGGSGYLAAFIGGLLFHITEKLHETEKFFNHTIEGFLKPMIFMLLGALINLESLMVYAPIGVVASLVFMIIIRPIAVFISLAPFYFWGKEKVTVKEMLFISAIRETGAIPAVLIVTIASLGIANIDGLVEIGMWVILMTLIVEPLLLPGIAKRLDVAEPVGR